MEVFSVGNELDESIERIFNFVSGLKGGRKDREGISFDLELKKSEGKLENAVTKAASAIFDKTADKIKEMSRRD